MTFQVLTTPRATGANLRTPEKGVMLRWVVKRVGLRDLKLTIGQHAARRLKLSAPTERVTVSVGLGDDDGLVAIARIVGEGFIAKRLSTGRYDINLRTVAGALGIGNDFAPLVVADVEVRSIVGERSLLIRLRDGAPATVEPKELPAKVKLVDDPLLRAQLSTGQHYITDRAQFDAACASVGLIDGKFAG